MAKIVLGLGTPHSPQLNIPASRWSLLVEKDQKDTRIDYESLVRQAKPGMEKELSEQKMQERHEAMQKALETLRQTLQQASPDVMIALGDDQHEQFLDDNMPMFCVYRGSSLTVVKRQVPSGRAWRQAEEEWISDAPMRFDAHTELADHLIACFVEQGFDVACSNRLREEVGLGHAFSFVYRKLLPAGNIPMVPVMLNTFYPPNQPSPRRCYAFGQALRAAVEAWDSNKKVAVITSGGLSHVVIDEALDRTLLDALQRKDREKLGLLPVEKLRLGTSEIRNWIATAGALEHLRMELIDYIPAYRSPAGTGCGMAFVEWR